MRTALPFAIGLLLSSSTLAAPSAARVAIVACAPGYPGNTEQAQPSMDAFAGGLAASIGWEPSRLGAVYHENLQDGLRRLSRTDAVIAMVPLPFYLQYRRELVLTPLLTAQPQSGADERWSLVARRGALEGPSSLEGWEVAGMPGYAPRFVRGLALSDWGPLPDDVGIRFSSRVLSELRRAARGEAVAALIDRAQADALPALPFAAELEVVARSRPLPANLVCSVGDRLGAADRETLTRGLLQLHETDGGAGLLAALRIIRFQRISSEALEPLEQAFEASAD